MKNLYIIISATDWDYEYWVSRHYIPKHIADSKDNTVIFIERSVSLISKDKNEVSWSKALKIKRLKKISENFFVFTPLPRPPFVGKLKFISNLMQIIQLFQINRLIKKFKIKNVNIISFDHRAGFIFKKLKQKVKTIYYVVDELTGFHWAPGNEDIIRREETNTIINSDLVICACKPLQDKTIIHNKNSVIVNHGVDIDEYLRTNNSLDDSSFYKIPKPIIGFMGKIEDWFNLDLLFDVAINLPDYSFVLIGGNTINIDKLINLPNVYHLGKKAKSTVPAYLKNFDIGIIPFKENELVRNVNPLKLYEYLAAGLPVISTPMDAVRGYDDYNVYIEDSTEGFISKIKYIISNDILNLNKQNRIIFAKNNSWNKKAEEVENYCNSIIKKF